MKTVLVADDEDFLRLLIRETLAGHRVLEACDGDEALAMARAETPDLIVLDWMMPGRDGPSVLRALRSEAATAEVPVLMVTAKLGAHERETLEAAGANALLAKPFGPAALRERVGELLSAAADAS